MRLNHGLAYHHKYNLAWVDEQPIWERDLYIDMLEEEVQAETNRAKMAAKSSALGHG
jgi:hypothetical protein